MKHNKKLYAWYQGWGRKYVKKRGVPHSIEVQIKDSPTEYAGRWTLYIPNYHELPPVGEYAFPKEVYFEVPANNKVLLDYMPWEHRVKVVSESMLNFFREQGFTDGYEVAVVKDVISRRGKIIETPKKYFALRFYTFDDELLDFQNEEEVVVKPTTDHILDIFTTKFSIYPNMRIKEGVEKKIFVLEHRTFDDALVFTEDIKKMIEEKGFIGPEIYSIEEFYKAFID